MPANIYKNLHTSVEMPHSFNHKQWLMGWQNAVQEFDHYAEKFRNTPNWDTYKELGKSIVHLNVLKEFITHFPLYLGGCSAAIRRNLEDKANTEFETLLISIKQEVMLFFFNEEDHSEETKYIKEERIFWGGFSTAKAEAFKIFQSFQSSECLVYAEQLNGLKDYPALRKKIAAKAQEKGFSGYAVNVNDSCLDLVISMQTDEDVRKNLWLQTQRNAPTDQVIDKTLKLRQRIAQENRFPHYMKYLFRSDLGMTSQKVQNILENSMATLAPLWNKLHSTMKHRGARLNNWSGTEQQFIQPWNENHLLFAAQPTELPLSGKEFPLKRILNTIVPDLLTTCGWTMMDTKPQKIGHNKQVLYLYRLHHEDNPLNKVLLYFAPYPYEEYNDNDNFQAYAAIVRERAIDNDSHIPVCFVAQNLDLVNGAIIDLQQLEFLAHEIGHVLHDFSFRNDTFGHFDRMPHNLSETPSVFYEAIAQCPQVLQRWTSPKAPASNRRIDYWERRVKPQNVSLLTFMTNLENSWLDMEINSAGPRKLNTVRSALRKRVGLPPLHSADRSAHNNFDFTENCGSTYSYLVGRALQREILGVNPTEETIRIEMKKLCDNVLAYSTDIQIAKRWKKTYNKTLSQMVSSGMEKLCADHSKQAKAYIRLMNKQKSK